MNFVARAYTLHYLIIRVTRNSLSRKADDYPSC